VIATEGEQLLSVTAVTLYAQKAMLETAAFELAGC